MDEPKPHRVCSLGLLFYEIIAETSGRREGYLMGGRQTRKEEGEKSV